nr:hypothetical protein [Tanacetum cinerariifolium]
MNYIIKPYNYISDSCGWKNILDLRDKVKDHVIFQVDNGKAILAWYKWCKLGPLTGFILNKAIFDARMSEKDCLADIISEGKWAWPDEWEIKFPEVKTITVPTSNDSKDGVKWVDRDNQPCQFSTKKVWLTLRDEWPKVNWSHIVWYSQCNPKQAVILWMAIQGRLLTHDRMVWVHSGDLKCSLCNVCPDSHDHLFFECQYSRTVWDKISSKGEMLNGLQKLSSVIRSMEAKSNKNTIWQVVNKLIIASTVYHFWNERNKRIFQNSNRTTNDLLKIITRNIEEMLMSLKVKKFKAVDKAAAIWGLRWNNFRLISHLSADCSADTLFKVYNREWPCILVGLVLTWSIELFSVIWPWDKGWFDVVSLDCLRTFSHHKGEGVCSSSDDAGGCSVVLYSGEDVAACCAYHSSQLRKCSHYVCSDQNLKAHVSWRCYYTHDVVAAMACIRFRFYKCISEPLLPPIPLLLDEACMFARSTHEVCLIHDKLMGVSLQVFNKSRLSDDARSTVISKVQEQYPELEVKPKQIVDTVRGQLHDGRLGVVAMGEGQGANKGECRTTIHHLCHHSTLTMIEHILKHEKTRAGLCEMFNF